MGQGILELMASSLRFLPEAVLLTETRSGLHEVKFANEAFQRLTGHSSKEIEGQDMKFLQGPETDAKVFQRLFTPMDNLGVSPVEVLLYRKDGTSFWDRVTTRALPDAPDWCVYVHSDITWQKEIESRLMLSQKREIASHLVSGITHDFNNLLTAIMVYSGLMAAKVHSDPQLQRYLDEIQLAAQRGSQLVTQFLDLARKESAQPVSIRPAEVIREMQDLLVRLLGEEIFLSFDLKAPLARIQAPLGRLQQVLLNLCVNARDAMPGGGHLTIRLECMSLESRRGGLFPGALPGHYVHLSVTDTGAGMDAETCANLFKPFFTTKAKGKGTGLGLFTVHTIVKQMGGHIRVESELGKGTTFGLLLPAEPEPQTTSAPG